MPSRTSTGSRERGADLERAAAAESSIPGPGLRIRAQAAWLPYYGRTGRRFGGVKLAAHLEAERAGSTGRAEAGAGSPPLLTDAGGEGPLRRAAESSPLLFIFQTHLFFKP